MPLFGLQFAITRSAGHKQGKTKDHPFISREEKPLNTAMLIAFAVETIQDSLLSASSQRMHLQGH